MCLLCSVKINNYCITFVTFWDKYNTTIYDSKSEMQFKRMRMIVLLDNLLAMRLQIFLRNLESLYIAPNWMNNLTIINYAKAILQKNPLRSGLTKEQKIFTWLEIFAVPWVRDAPRIFKGREAFLKLGYNIWFHNIISHT